MNPYFENIPKELKAVNQWVCWKQVPRGNKKPDKLPIDPNTGKAASSTDPNTWVSFEKAVNYFEHQKGLAGIGFVFTEKDPFAGVDLDNCRNPETGELTEKATDILNRLNSYTEISPSGTGVHSIVKGRLPGRGADKNGVEIYDRLRFFTVTGRWVGSFSGNIENRGEQLQTLYEKAGGGNGTSPGMNTVGWQDELLSGVSGGSRHRTALRLAGRWATKGLSDAEIVSLLISWNERNDPPKESLSDPSSKELQDIISYVRGKQPETSEDPLTFPSNVIRGSAGVFAGVYASYLEVPEHFFFLSYLTCLGVVLADHLTLASELRPQPRLYLLLLGESATDRKSTALTKVTDFFKTTIEGFPMCWGVGSAEGLQKRMNDGDCLLLCFDEFKQFVGKAKIENSVLLPCINTLFESNRYESRTKKTSIHLENAHLSMLAASTVETYERTWDTSFTDIGFNNRLFLVPGTGEKRFSFPPEIPQHEKESLKKDLVKVQSHVGDGLKLEITPEAKQLYHEWYMGLDDSIHTKRLDTYAMRFMSLLAVNDLQDEVNEQVVQDVLDLVDWQYRVRQRHDPIQADSKVAKLEEKIRRVLKTKGCLSDRDLKRATHAHRAGLWMYESALNNLKKAHELGWDKNSNGWGLR